MFENIYIQQRIEKANKLREDGINPYSNESSRNCTISKYLNVNSDIFQLEEKRDENRNYTVAGRIKFFRLMGKASFLKIEDESGMLQIYVARDNLPENFYNEIFKKNIFCNSWSDFSNCTKYFWVLSKSRRFENFRFIRTRAIKTTRTIY